MPAPLEDTLASDAAVAAAPKSTTQGASLDDTFASDAAAMATLAAAAPRGRGDGPHSFVNGDTIGRYLLLERLGAGAMGVVYAAYDPQLDRKVALKLLLPELAQQSSAAESDQRGQHGEEQSPSGSATDAASARLLREAQALARLDHPNVVTVHDVGAHQGRVFIAMEFVRGKTLKAYLREHKRGWREVLDYLLAAAHGLAAAHSVNLVHRDFKPDNVMVGDDGRVRVMDFGLARAERLGPDPTSTGSAAAQGVERAPRNSAHVPPSTSTGSLELDKTGEVEPDPLAHAPGSQPTSPELTMAGMIMGTPAYMAPEQFGSADVGPLADQFSFAVALWEALYGERPFAGANFHELAAAVCEGRRRPPPAGTRVPNWLRRIIEKGLAPDPKDRWPSMQAMVAAIERQAATARRRAIGLVIVLVLAIVGGTALGGRVSREHAIDACNREGASIQETYNNTVRNRLARKMRATDVAYAENSIRRVTKWLGRWADLWATERTAICRHEKVERDWSAQEVQLAVECLEERRSAFETAVDALSEVDAESIVGAVGAAAELPDLEPCTDRRALARRPRPPADAAADIAKVRDEITRANARFDAGQYARARKLAGEAVDHADAIGWQPLRARARLIFAAASDRAGDSLAAASALADAYFLASESEDFESAADAATRAIYVFGVRLARRDEAEAWARHARIALLRIDEFEGNTVRRGRWLNLTGLTARERGDLDVAIEQHQQAVRVYKQVLGREHPAVAASMGNLALDYEARGDVEQALDLSTQALALETAVFGEEHPEVVISMGNLGMLLDRAGRHEDAKAQLQIALALGERVLSPQHHELARIRHNLADVHSNLGEDEMARHLYEQALAGRIKALGSEHPDVASTLTGLGILAYRRREYDEASRLYAEALTVQERAQGNDHIDVARGLVNFGNAERELGRLAEAVIAYRRAVGIFENRLGAEDPEVAFALRNLGLAQERLGQTDAARATFERALAIREASFGREDPSTVSLRKSLAAIAEQSGSPQIAAEQLAIALRIRRNEGDDPLTLAPMQFALARALDGTSQPIPQASNSATTNSEFAGLDAVALAQDAHAALTRSGTTDEGRKLLAEIEAWLKPRARTKPDAGR